MKVTTKSFKKPGSLCKSSIGMLRLYVAAFCGVLLTTSVQAQPDTATTEPNTAAVQKTNTTDAVNVEDPDSAKEAKQPASEWDWDEDWEKGQHGVRREAVVAIRKDAELKADDW